MSGTGTGLRDLASLPGGGGRGNSATGGDPTPGGRAPRRPRRAVVVVVALLLLALVIAVVAAVFGGPGTRPLDPDDPGAEGAQALVRVLADQGVPTTAVRSAAELDAAAPGAGATVVVTGDLSRSATDALLQHREVDRLVLVSPSERVLAAVGTPARLVGRSALPETAGCAGDVLLDDDTLAPEARLYRPAGDDVTTCFVPDPGEGPAPSAPAGAWLERPAAAGRPAVTVVGQPEVFGNVGTMRATHAAIALRLLGDADRVLWYVPEVDRTPAAADRDAPAPPAWTGPVLALGAFTFLLLCLWRGRRLGPLVTEPLPVSVPASETTRARARLYRRAREVPAVTAVLRGAALDDLRHRLRLSPDADPPTVAHAAARATGDTAEEILDLLTRDVGEDDLLAHTRRLRALRRKVRTS